MVSHPILGIDTPAVGAIIISTRSGPASVSSLWADRGLVQAESRIGDQVGIHLRSEESRADLTPPSSILSSRKRLRCEICNDRLGTYEVLALGDESIWQVKRIRLPVGMVNLAQPVEQRPEGAFFLLEWSVRWEQDNSLGSKIPRYRWRDRRGHEQVLRGTRWPSGGSAGDSIETI
jgi:hypothetical protein